MAGLYFSTWMVRGLPAASASAQRSRRRLVPRPRRGGCGRRGGGAGRASGLGFRAEIAEEAGTEAAAADIRQEGDVHQPDLFFSPVDVEAEPRAAPPPDPRH